MILLIDPLNLGFLQGEMDDGSDAILADFDGKSLRPACASRGQTELRVRLERVRGTPINEGIAFNPCGPVLSVEQLRVQAARRLLPAYPAPPVTWTA